MKLIYRPRSAQASNKLAYTTPLGVVEITSSGSTVDLTSDQIDWLKSKYDDFKLAVESSEIIIIDDEPAQTDAGKKRPGKAALLDAPPHQ